MASSLAGERIGSIPVNVLRLAMACPAVAAVATWLHGPEALLGASAAAWRPLLLSGFVGYFLGDLCLFRALVEIGPRRSLLVMSLAPPITVAIAAAWLGERLAAHHYVAMGLTLAGVATVVTERVGAGEPRRPTRRGWWLAFGGCLGQAVGMVLAKEGVAHTASAWVASAMRLTAGATAFLVLAAVRREGGRLRQALRDAPALGLVALGALAGPIGGVTLMLFALTRIPAGLAQTFAATTPVLIIPLSRAILREQIGLRALAGAALAVAGVALLFHRC